MMARKHTTLTLETSRWILARVWFIGAGMIVLLLIVLSIFRSEFRGDLEKLWAWILPALIPTLSLIITAVRAGTINPARDKNKVKSAFHQLTFWLSITYLAILFLTIVVQPLTEYDLVELFTISNYWIAPIQGLVIASMATVFFTDQEK